MSDMLITAPIWDEFMILINNLIECLEHSRHGNNAIDVFADYIENMEEKNGVILLINKIVDIICRCGVVDKELDKESLRNEFTKFFKKSENVEPTKLPSGLSMSNISGVVNFGPNSSITGPGDVKLNNEIRKLTSELNKCKEKLVISDCEHKRVKSENEGLFKENERLSSNVEKLDSTIVNLRAKNDDLNTKILDLLTENPSLRSEVGLNQTSSGSLDELSTFRKENKDLKNKLNAKEEDLDTEKNKVNDLNDKIDDLKTNHKRCQEIQLKDVREENKDLKNKLIAKEEDLDTEKNKVNDLKKMIDDLKTKDENHKRCQEIQLKDVREENKDMKNKLIAKEEDLNTEKNKVNDLNDKIDDLKTNHKRCQETKLKDARKKNEDLQEEIDTSKNEVDKLKKEIRILENEKLADARKENKDLQNKLNTKKEKLKAGKCKVDELNEKIKKLVKDKDDIEEEYRREKVRFEETVQYNENEINNLNEMLSIEREDRRLPETVQESGNTD